MAGIFPNNRITYIYTLTDPRDGLVKYVGKTIDVSKRKSAHLNAPIVKKEKTRNAVWLRKLKKLGHKPIFNVIDEVLENWESAEMGYIKFFKSCGAVLNNHTSGGDKGCLGRILTKKERKKISDSHKGKPKSEEHKKKVGEANSKRWKSDPEFAKKNGDRLRSFNYDLGHKFKVLEGQKKRRKLTDEMIFDIMKAKESGEKIVDLAKKFNVCTRTITITINKYKKEHNII